MATRSEEGISDRVKVEEQRGKNKQNTSTSVSPELPRMTKPILSIVQSRELEKTDEVAGEDSSSRLPSCFVEELSTPPPIFGGISDGDNVTRLEVEFFIDRGLVIIQSFDWTR